MPEMDTEGYKKPVWKKAQAGKTANVQHPAPKSRPKVVEPRWKVPTWAELKAAWNNPMRSQYDQRSQYVPPGLSNTQRPTTAAQFNLPKTATPKYQTGSFFAGGGADPLVRTGQATNAPLSTTGRLMQVRTGEGEGEPIQWQPGMGTGTFFSGYQPPAAQMNLYNDMRGRGTNRNAGFMVTPPYVQQRPVTPTGGGSAYGGGYGGYGYGGGYGGGRGGGGGGGGTYTAAPKSWYMNLMNWNFKG